MLKMTLMTMMPTLLFFSACGPAPEKKVAVPSVLPKPTEEELVLQHLAPETILARNQEAISTLSGELSHASRENILEGHTIVAGHALGQKPLSDGLHTTFDFSEDAVGQLDYLSELCRDESCRTYEGRSKQEIQAECRKGGEVIRENGVVLCHHEAQAKIIKSQDQRYFAMAHFGDDAKPTATNTELVELERLNDGHFRVPWTPTFVESK